MGAELEEMSDAALILGIGRWRQDALAEVYRRHAGAVFALARRVLLERTLAEEIVQEIFVRLWYSADRFDPDRGSLRSFLLAQAHGRAVDLLRSETSRKRREEREAASQGTPTYDLETDVEDLDSARKVRDAMGRLPDGERQAIELAYFGGRTYREVADVLGQPEGTIKSRIRSGLKRLRVSLDGEGLTEP